MEIIVAATTVALVLVFLAAHTLPEAERTHRPKRPTVADVQTRLAAEPPRPYVPISRGW
ncbi:hypothetical protein H0264_09330 [Nocardia huaxiensis]|uniref:Uncharacterized protein n=1 Tax=Nocardia huaxiensis TaxID=2755382 RepID=A0A7D6ZZL8_9NOCA|nr:hypothetical protein [Nocardia huaxiensis]QLY32429.1 hypothetical protein H0264_09330 [Nocardia huaxiensis]